MKIHFRNKNDKSYRAVKKNKTTPKTNNKKKYGNEGGTCDCDSIY